MCDTFCVRTTDGMLFAKSSDRPVAEPQVLRWFDRRPGGESVATTHSSVPDAGAVALLGSQPTWMWGLEHGLNAHGVAVGNEKIWTVDDPHAAPPALIGMDLVRLGLERGRSADDALDVVTSLLETHGQGGSGEREADEPYWSSFLLADAHGGWVLETSGRSWVAQPIGAGAAISNRVSLSTDWTRSSADIAPGTDWDTRRAPDAPTGIADHRLRATSACVSLGERTTAADAVAALRDHGSGPWGAPGRPRAEPVAVPADIGDDWSGVTVCMHIRDYQCTTASLVTLLPTDAAAPVRTWASLGSPCAGVFLPVALLTPGAGPAERSASGAAPEASQVAMASALGDAEVWAQLSALTRRVEQTGPAGAEALATIRAALDPIEDAAWAVADELWSAAGGPDRWRTATADWDRQLRSALTTLAPTPV